MPQQLLHLDIGLQFQRQHTCTHHRRRQMEAKRPSTSSTASDSALPPPTTADACPQTVMTPLTIITSEVSLQTMTPPTIIMSSVTPPATSPNERPTSTAVSGFTSPVRGTTPTPLASTRRDSTTQVGVSTSFNFSCVFKALKTRGEK